MIGLQTEHKLAQLLKSIAEGEKEIEVVRQVLAEQPDFEPYTAFKRIDRLGFGSHSQSSSLNFLRDNEIYALDKDLSNLYKVYDSNCDGRLSYSEFLNAVLPKTSPVLRSLATGRQSYYVSKYEALPYETEWALARVYDKEINYLRKVELLKEDLTMRYDWSFLEAFKLIDAERIGAIDFDSAYIFLKRNHIIAAESDILALLRRADKDGDGKISYAEFVDALTPFDPYTGSSVRRSMVAEERARSSTPQRANRSALSQSGIHNTTSKKPSNVDYYDYLSSSNGKNRSVERASSPTRQSTYQTPKKGGLSSSTYISPSKEYKSPLKEIEESQLARALKEQADLDRDLENLKNELSLKSDYNLLDAFRFFDQEGRGFITKTELRFGFNEFGLYPTSDECYLIMRKYDTDNDGLLRYADFAEMMTPKASEYANILNDRIPTYADKNRLNLVFTYTTKNSMKLVLNSILKNENASEDIRLRLNRRPLFSVYESFKALDKSDKGFVSLSEFKDMLIENGIYASYKDLDNLVHRYDKNQDGRVSYYDFVQEMTPKSPSKY
jgi:Ca2+-binding EF-hand superfamily protein